MTFLQDVRLMTYDDIPSLMEFFYEDRNVTQDQAFNYDAEDLENMLLLPHAIQLVWIDRDNPTKVIGYIGGFDMGTWGLLDVIIVRKSHRNKHVGTWLFSEFINFGPQWKSIETSHHYGDDKAKKFLTHCGFNTEQHLIWMTRKQ